MLFELFCYGFISCEYQAQLTNYLKLDNCETQLFFCYIGTYISIYEIVYIQLYFGYKKRSGYMTSNDYIQIYQSNLKESPHNPNIHYIQYYLFSQ